MTTRRLYVREIPGEGDRVILDGGASRHIRVLRLRVGDTLSLFDGRGREVLAEVEELGAAGVRCKIGAPVPTALGSIPVTLIQALPKANKMDGIVRMATELGVDAVYPVTSHRAVPKVEGTKSEQRVQRWNRIAAEASRQSSRATVPRVHPIGSLAEVAQGVPVDALRIVFWEEARGAVLSPEWFSDPSSIWLLVGPEGGLEAGEVEPLLEAGWALSGLGSTVLRVETAGPVALALVMDRLRTRIR
ncbi:MAG: 16S rRNA (uracil(1498)-N(3))-methyltransferase [Myxococcales bacterium]|nr:16S rRNA (uracil(1498)-N(3))-methyltransferase [Myxococcales bacterium]